MPEKISPVRERRRWKEETIHDIRTLLPIVRKFVVHTTVDGHDEDICFILPPLPITHATVDQCGLPPSRVRFTLGGWSSQQYCSAGNY